MDADKIKNFLILHFEKMVLVLVIGASAFLIYKGTEKPNFLDTEQPEKLTEKATNVKSEIDVNHNVEIIPPRVPTLDILAETEKVYTPVDPGHYSTQPWDPSNRASSIVRRQDPILIPPRSLRVVGVSTAIAVRSKIEAPDDYALAKLEDADPLEKVEAKPVRQPRRQRRSRGMDEDMMMGMDDMEMEMDMEMDMDMDMMGPSMGGSRKFDSKYDFGKRPAASEDKTYPVPEVGWFIAGTAVVPHKELYEAFEQALRDADKYVPGRDTPFYFNLEIQRADVTDKAVEELTEADWIKSVQGGGQSLWDRELLTKLAAYKWFGFAPEIVPEDYRDEALSGWIPPVLLDDYAWFAVHPQIPMISQSELKKLANVPEEKEALPEFDPLAMDDSVGLLKPGQRAVPGMGMGGMSMDMMEMDMEMMDEDMGGMMMGMGRAMMSRGIDTDPVDYKLIRFYDFFGFQNSPKPGRKYVYRIRYSVVDPNFPFIPSLQPQANTLAPDVIQRVQELMTKAKESGTRTFQRWSDWSEPSEPASLPTLEQYFVGPVTRGTISTWKVRTRGIEKDVEYARDMPTAKLLASQYDLATGARIPMRLEVGEGTVLSHKAESADVVDPITLRVKKMPDAELFSETTVVDIDGGAPLKIAESLTEPGLMLLFDASGKLKVTDEVRDQEYYRIYSYADERGE